MTLLLYPTRSARRGCAACDQGRAGRRSRSPRHNMPWPGRYRSRLPRHNMPFNSRNETSVYEALNNARHRHRHVIG
jgi:hypothetical protein